MTEKTVVLTMFGKGDEVEEVSVNLFDTEGNYYESNSSNPARLYCATINSFKLADDAWAYAQIVKLNKKVKARKPLQFDIIAKMGDRDLALVIKETKNSDLLRVLLGADDETKEKIFQNMSKLNSKSVKEDMEALHGVGEDEIKAAKDAFIETIQKMSANGNIRIAWGKA